MKVMITCQQATKFISQREEGRLSIGKMFQLWYHLGICGICKIFNKQNKIIIRNLPHAHKHINVSLTPLEKESIIAALEKN